MMFDHTVIDEGENYRSELATLRARLSQVEGERDELKQALSSLLDSGRQTRSVARAAFVELTARAEKAEQESARLREALRFYADKNHFGISDEDAWDTVSGEPGNFWCDEAGTATVEDGWVARTALGGE